MPFPLNNLAAIPWQGLDTRPYTPGMFGGGPILPLQPQPGQTPTYTPEVDPTGQNWNRSYATPGGNPNIPAWTDPTGGLYQQQLDANRWQGPGLPPNLYQPTSVTGTPIGGPVTDPNLYDRNGNYRGGIESAFRPGSTTPAAPYASTSSYAPAAPTGAPTPGTAPAAPAWGAAPTAPALGTAPTAAAFGAAPGGPAFGAAPGAPQYQAAAMPQARAALQPTPAAPTTAALNPLSQAIQRPVAQGMGSFGYGAQAPPWDPTRRRIPGQGP